MTKGFFVVSWLAFLGILDAGYLTYEKFYGLVPPCSAYFQCQTVLTSPWSSIGPVPVSVLGIFYYTALLVLGCLYLSGRRQLFGLQLGRLAWLLSLAGFIASLGFVFLMMFIIKAWCLYCLLSAANCTILMSLLTAMEWQSRRKIV